MEKKKLTEEELNKLQDLNTKYREYTEMLGNIEIQKINLDIQKDKTKRELIETQHKEEILAKELENKYGSGRISLSTGEIFIE